MRIEFKTLSKIIQLKLRSDLRGIPEQYEVQEFLRHNNIMIDMFYEDGMWSGRVFKLNDPEERWKSCSTTEYEKTLELMLYIGLEYL